MLNNIFNNEKTKNDEHIDNEQEWEYICDHCGFLSMVARNCPVCKVPLIDMMIPDNMTNCSICGFLYNPRDGMENSPYDGICGHCYMDYDMDKKSTNIIIPPKNTAQKTTSTPTIEKYTIEKSKIDQIFEKFTKPEIEPNTLTLTPYAYTKLMTYVHLIDSEIAGMGKVEDGVISDVGLYKQEVTGTTADTVDNNDLIDFFNRYPSNEWSKWCLQWHSHVNMSPTPSHTDTQNNDDLLKTGFERGFYPLIINKRGEYTLKYRARLTDARGGARIKPTVDFLEEIPLNEYYEKEMELKFPNNTLNDGEINSVIDECVNDIEMYVQKKTYTTQYNYNYNNPVHGAYVNSDSYWDKYKK